MVTGFVKKGDVIVNKLLAWMGAIGVSEYDGVTSPAYDILRASKPVDSKFYHYLFRNQICTSKLKQHSKGIMEMRLRLYFDEFGNIKIPYPPFEEQQRIVAFIDRTTAEIDEAIAKKQRLIELLQEQKAILINQAVTKGLNPKAPMRDSGVEWIGEIPEHWEVRRAKYIFKEVDERSKTGTEELLSVSHITGVTPRSEKNVNMFMAEDYSGSKLCQKDDIVINIMWAWMGALGVSTITGIVSPSYGVFRQLKAGIFNSWYLEHLLRSTEYVAEYNRRSTGLHSSRLRLYADMFLSMEITLPPKEEQDKIEIVTNERVADIDKAINAIEREIISLEELRSIIILQAVTGKIKV
ncbi:restriction endonuclease subunit S [Nostoc sp. KVJ3]|uniref:restriction endonuclease subunit S n=1 Tax=Nostoc sp. KVJ3 TaxID=457945 RepID=UPI002237CF57|nr:restriction endonuclease subunit S [Nostoc sp. KVJ3]MCW5319591.1 restriction endonuclease subunit S [Nostoc sp. KVJ3]